MIDENTRVRNESSLLEANRPADTFLIEGSTVYLGYKWQGGVALNDPMWSIKRIQMDPDTGLVTVMWAEGNRRQYIFQFSECKTYNYSFA
jgi:hypothetical protein